jgi:hypothetical protein
MGVANRCLNRAAWSDGLLDLSASVNSAVYIAIPALIVVTPDPDPVIPYMVSSLIASWLMAGTGLLPYIRPVVCEGCFSLAWMEVRLHSP